MAQRPISVSIRADRIFTQSLKALAQVKGTTVADLTREALDKCLGSELTPFLVFFTNSVNADRQSASNGDSGPGAA